MARASFDRLRMRPGHDKFAKKISPKFPPIPGLAVIESRHDDGWHSVDKGEGVPEFGTNTPAQFLGFAFWERG